MSVECLLCGEFGGTVTWHQLNDPKNAVRYVAEFTCPRCDFYLYLAGADQRKYDRYRPSALDPRFSWHDHTIFWNKIWSLAWKTKTQFLF